MVAVVVEAGADLFGLIFAPVRRQVTIERAAEIVRATRAAAGSRPPLAVGVFVDASVEEIERVVARTGIDLVQLHGDERAGGAERTRACRRSWRCGCRRAAPLPKRSGSWSRFAAATRPPAGLPDRRLSGRVRTAGAACGRIGAGRRACASRWPIMLAGGLTPDNVAEAIAAVRPLAVDVSSGVETDGVKDEAKIRGVRRRREDGISGAG